VIFGGEYRLKLFDFDFFKHLEREDRRRCLRDGGRVFMKETDVLAEAGDTTTVAPEDATPLPKTKDEMRWSYGGGVRFALGEATIARVDVGFSEEEQGLVYLVFGHTF